MSSHGADGDAGRGADAREHDLSAVDPDDAVVVDPADPALAEDHDGSWSVNLEQPVHADDRDRLVRAALLAVERTAPGHHVNLVTHGDHGHPEGYLYGELDAHALDYEFVERCGCGGFVTRVHVRE
jgi:putative CGCGG family rSAM target protein